MTFSNGYSGFEFEFEIEIPVEVFALFGFGWLFAGKSFAAYDPYDAIFSYKIMKFCVVCLLTIYQVLALDEEI